MSRLPTTDLYFLNACGHVVSRWLRPRPLRPLGENCFETGGTVLLIRQDNEALMRDVRRRAGRLIYLIDDDIEGARDSETLPADYRVRLMRFHEEHHRALTERADTLVVTSPALQARFSWHRDVRLLHPVWHLPMADDAHFEEPENGGPLRSIHIGSGSHAGGLTFLRPVIGALLDSHERFHFSYFGREPNLGPLDRHPRVTRLRPLSWRRYRPWIARQRFHLGFYPVADTAFDKARSYNKLLEYGVVGAVGVYSKQWSAAEQMKEQVLLADEPQEWIDIVSSLINAPESLRELADKAHPVLDRLNDPAIQRRFWSELLDVAF